MTRKLPPDADGMNGSRAEWAGAALSAFMKETGADQEDALGDLLADLMHWADRNNYDFELALDRARWHYEAETLGGRPS
jgi:NTP pyrophosphatase (non-canonical NTP hydrolase)